MPGQEGPSPPIYTPPPIPSGYPGPSAGNSNEIDTGATSITLPPDVMLITRAKVHEAAMQATPKVHISYAETSEGPSHTPVWTVRCLGMSIDVFLLPNPRSSQMQSTTWSKGGPQPKARTRAKTWQPAMPTLQWAGIALAVTDMINVAPFGTSDYSSRPRVSSTALSLPHVAHDLVLYSFLMFVCVGPTDDGGAPGSSLQSQRLRPQTSPGQL
jgi:hypothetical protein